MIYDFLNRRKTKLNVSLRAKRLGVAVSDGVDQCPAGIDRACAGDAERVPCPTNRRGSPHLLEGRGPSRALGVDQVNVPVFRAETAQVLGRRRRGARARLIA